MDRMWWNEYALDVAGSFELWTTNVQAARIWRLQWLRSELGGGVSTRPDTIRLGGNSGFQAVGLARHFGAARIVLLGYDMQLTGGRSHWHGDHRKLGNPAADKFRDWHHHFTQFAAHAPGLVLNATRESALKCFPKAELHACLAEPEAGSTGAPRRLRKRA